MPEDIGTLRANLVGDVSNFVDGMEEAQSVLARFAEAVTKQLANVEATIKKVSVGLTVGITAPFAAMSAVSAKGAGGFESAMNRVQAALQGIDPKQLEEMSKQARLLGPGVGKSAVEAASGIETLALAGMSASGILNGGLKQTLLLAGANMANLDAAGAAVTDVMSQFGKTSADLPPIVDKITGALDSSKFGFVDFQQAISQAGGVAGAAGVTFDDFNTAIAATSTLFASGSDAGTSFKTFITSLSPKSKEAEGAMKKLGLSFYDASGKIKDMGDIAQMLQDKLGKLSNRSQTEAMTTMFGSDAMRTAIGLMKQGKAGFEELQATIAKGDAGSKLAIQMQGYEASVNRMSAAFEGLKISIGATGLLDLFTSFTTSVGNMVNRIAQANPVILQIAVGLWAMAAAMGPLGIAVLTLAKVGLFLFVSRLGLMGTLIFAMINPLGFLAVQFVRLSVALTGAGSALNLFALGLARVLVPLGLAIAAIGLLYLALGRQATASDEVQAATDATSKAMAAYEEAALAAATATGEARKEAQKLAAMKRQEALNSLNAAKASLADARAKVAQAKAAQAVTLAEAHSDPDPRADAALFGVSAVQQGRLKQQEANAAAFEKSAAAAEKQFKAADAVIAAAAAVDTGTINMDFGGEEKAKKTAAAKAGVSAAEIASRREEMKLQQALDVATARADIEEQRRLKDLLDIMRRQQEYEQAGLKAGAAKVAAAQDLKDLRAAEAEEQARQVSLAEDAFDLDLSRIREDAASVRRLERQEYLNERIAFWQSKGLTLLQAQGSATSDLAHMEAARLERLQNVEAARARDREVELARTRGDSSGRVRALERDAEMQRRIKEYQDEAQLSAPDAAKRAKLELDEEERARLQGDFRNTFKDGVRAAMDGDLKGFVKNWWTERLAKSLEDALNSVADMIMNLFSKVKIGGGGEGGGGLGRIFSSIGKALGLVSGTASLGGSSAGGVPIGDIFSQGGISGGAFSKLPGFKDGGSFEVGGMSGIDRNLVAFRATAGEIVNIKKPGNDNGRAIQVTVASSPYFDARVQEVTEPGIQQMGARAASGGSSMAQQALARRQRQQLGRR